MCKEVDEMKLGVGLKPVEKYTGRGFRVIHRSNDVEDKWISSQLVTFASTRRKAKAVKFPHYLQ